MTQIIITEIKMVPVVSSCIMSIGTDGERLLVEFVRAGTYVYGHGSAKLFDQLLAARSKGKFVNSILKPAYDGVLFR